MIKAGRYDLDESSIGRIHQHVVSNPKVKNWGVVTASRGELTAAENKQRNKELEADLRKLGYGYVHVDGMWQECRKPDTEYKDCPDDMKVPTTEKSLFVPNISKEHIQSLGKKYQQDSVLFADEETKAKGEATFIDSKSGEAFNIGKFSPGKVAQGYSKLKGGQVFTFEPKDEPQKADEPKIQTKAEPGSEKMVSNPTKLKSLLPKGIADKMIKNPETGKMIKVKSALKYDKNSPVYKATVAMVKQAAKK
jgi:hypothetical protein